MINPMNLEGKIILVTGASSGIGRDASVLLSELGAQVILVGRNHGRLEETANMLAGAGHRVEAFDLTGVNAIPGWLKRVASETGPIDGLVHSAGMTALRPVRLVTKEGFAELMDINVGAAIGLSKAFRQKNVNRAGGSIVYVSSVAGLIGQAGRVEYCASKAALVGVCKSLALELAKEQIRVNCVAPGWVNTEMAERAAKTLSPDQLRAIEAYHPLGIGSPRDVSMAIAFLLAATGRWITGTTLVVDGGYTAH